MYKILFLILISFSSFAQKTLKGLVYNNKGEVIAGANILIPSLNKILYSDQKGIFYFSTNKDSINLKVSHVGYISKEFFISTDNISSFKFILDDGIILNDEIKVTSTRVKKNSPYAYTNISKKSWNKKVNYSRFLIRISMFSYANTLLLSVL